MNTFLKKIPEPPAILKNTLAFYEPGKGRKLPESLKAIEKKENYEPVIFRGMGCSCFTSFAALNLFVVLELYLIRSMAAGFYILIFRVLKCHFPVGNLFEVVILFKYRFYFSAIS